LTAIGQEPLKAKNYLKDQSKLLEENSEELFGDSFRKHVKDTAKAKKESKEVFMKPKEVFMKPKQQRPPFAENRGFNNNQRPFPKRPSA